MRARPLVVLLFIFLIVPLFFGGLPSAAHAEIITVYSQPDDSGEILSQQPTFQNTFITTNLGNLALGKDILTITFTLQDPNASNIYGQPGGVALGTCDGCQDLQSYSFTDAERTLIANGAFHTFTVQTGTTTLGVADGTIPIYLTFFNLSQYHQSTRVKSNSENTIPYLVITTPEPPPPSNVPEAPEGSVTVYSQTDSIAVMTNPQETFQNAYIDSASLGNLNLGQEKLYITFTIKDPNAGNVYHTPQGVCIEPADTSGCGTRMQTYYFTDEDRTLLADGAFHTFMVETGTTTSQYADGTQPVAIGFFGLSQYQYGTKIKSNVTQTIPYLIIKKDPPPTPAPTCTLAASPTSVTLGNASTLSWTTTDATSFIIDNSVGTSTPTASGSSSISPATTTPYTGTATGASGTITCATTVTVTEAPPPPPPATTSSSPGAISIPYIPPPSAPTVEPPALAPVATATFQSVSSRVVVAEKKVIKKPKPVATQTLVVEEPTETPAVVAVQPKRLIPPIPQTASVYDAVSAGGPFLEKLIDQIYKYFYIAILLAIIAALISLFRYRSRLKNYNE